MEQIESKVKEIIVKNLGVKESEVTSNASFKDDLGADSLDAIELIMDFEKEFNVTIDDFEATEKINTVDDAIDYIKNLI